MTDSLANVVIPYSRFLECQERREDIAAELARPDRPATIEADVEPAPPEPAAPQTLK